MNAEIIEKADLLIIELTEYDEATARLFDVSFNDEFSEETVEVIELILSERETVRRRVEAAHGAFVEAIGSMQIDYNTELGQKVREMLTLQLEIMKKDKDFNIRFTKKYQEVKTALRESQDDKKKLDYLHSNAGVQLGGSGFKA